MIAARRMGFLFAALSGLSSCQQADSVVVVSVTTASGVGPIDQLRALMSNGVATTMKLYPEQAAPAPLAFATGPITFAVVVPRGRTGALDIAVDGLSAGAASASVAAQMPVVVASGAGRALLSAGGRSDVSILLVAGPSTCGNGALDPGEPCDDGNRFSGDGCDFRCQPEASGAGGAAGRAVGGHGGEAGGRGSGGSAVGGNSGLGGGPSLGGAGGVRVSTGGVMGVGGTGTGGAPATGGAAAGGAGVPATGGAPGTGGMRATGGAPATGGISASGGAPATGGMPGSGGVPASGGAGGRAATGGVGGAGGAVDSSLQVWYRLDDAAGTSAADASGNGRTGTLVSVSPGSASFSTTAQVGPGAVDLMGQGTTGGGYVLLPGSLGALAPDAVTIACWVSLRTSPAEARLFDFGVDANTSMFLTPRHAPLLGLGSDVILFQIAKGALSQQTIQSTSALPIGGWHHVAVVLRGGSPYTGALYVDGALAAMKTGMTLHPSDLGVTLNNWLGRSTTGTSDPFLDGLLDDFRLYSRALADSEIAGLYQAGAAVR